MKIGYFSPFSPDPSGISDFSEELLPELKKYIDIDLFSRAEIENKNFSEQFHAYAFDAIDDDDFRKQYDFLIYQVGNNRLYHKGVIDTFLKYPDILEFHDLSLHHYLAEDTYLQNDFDKYTEIMKYCHGNRGERTAKLFLNGIIRAPWENNSAKYTVNKHLIDKARAVIVHSDFAKQFVKGIRPDIPIISIPLHTPDIIADYEEYRKKCKQELGIDQKKIVFGSFGYATIAKRIEQIIQALSIFKRQTKKDFLYYIVGQVEHIDIPALVSKYDLENQVVVTGFTEIDAFKKYMGACDVCFNLRYPTQGESSASLHRMLGMGKPILVTGVGSFEEYPDDIVVKIRHDENEIQDISDALSRLLKSDAELIQRSRFAYEYADENCNLQKNAKRYVNFLNQIKYDSFTDLYEDCLLDRMQELHMLDDEYISKFMSGMGWFYV